MANNQSQDIFTSVLPSSSPETMSPVPDEYWSSDSATRQPSSSGNADEVTATPDPASQASRLRRRPPLPLGMSSGDQWLGFERVDSSLETYVP